VDPDEVLRNMIEHARSVIAISDDEMACRLADEVLELHDWLQKGGFLPAAWTTGANGRVRS
jgi:hypothetical protein